MSCILPAAGWSGARSKRRASEMAQGRCNGHGLGRGQRADDIAEEHELVAMAQKR